MYNAHWQVTCGCGVASAQSCYTEVSGYSLADFNVVSVPVRMVALTTGMGRNLVGGKAGKILGQS